MPPVKICPTCGSESPPSEMMCPRCFGDISWVCAVEPGGSGEKKEEPAPPSGPGQIVLEIVGGDRVVACSGDVVGRKEVGKDVLEPFEKVSRRHARFTFRDGAWHVEDLDSSNGTYLDGRRVLAGEQTLLRDGQELKMSSTFTATVRIDGEDPSSA